MKTLVFNIESSKDVDLAVELIKKLNTPVEVISSPLAESKDPVVTYYEQKVEVPAEVQEISREEEEEELTGEELAEMDFEELEDVCDDKDLETDPDDYDEDDIEKLRKAIAKELGLKLPAKKEAKGKGKKGKK